MVEQSQETRQAVLESRFDSHEEICGKRYGEITGSFERVHSRLDGINRGVVSLLVTIALMLISALGTVVWQLLTRA